ncbi:hypothetical protein BD560DRAFT_438456 [Blakeslea trispora]|nr:hypothetical protein BD560DRAFT_438456 [Blakeslea trispora]
MQSSIVFANATFEEILDDLSRHCPLLHQWAHEHERAYADFMQYRFRIPVCGAIILNTTLDKCLLVKGWSSKSGWGFPKGKINQDEEYDCCAAREVLEETGYDVGPLLKKSDYIELTMREQRIRLYIIQGVPEDTQFVPRTRKEISQISWIKLEDLPTYKSQDPKQGNGGNNGGGYSYFKAGPYRFYMVVPFVNQLKKFIGQRKKTIKKDKKPSASPRPQKQAQNIPQKSGESTDALKSLLGVPDSNNGLDSIAVTASPAASQPRPSHQPPQVNTSTAHPVNSSSSHPFSKQQQNRSPKPKNKPRQQKQSQQPLQQSQQHQQPLQQSQVHQQPSQQSQQHQHQTHQYQQQSQQHQQHSQQQQQQSQQHQQHSQQYQQELQQQPQENHDLMKMLKQAQKRGQKQPKEEKEEVKKEALSEQMDLWQFLKKNLPAENFSKVEEKPKQPESPDLLSLLNINSMNIDNSVATHDVNPSFQQEQPSYVHRASFVEELLKSQQQGIQSQKQEQQHLQPQQNPAFLSSDNIRRNSLLSVLQGGSQEHSPLATPPIHQQTNNPLDMLLQQQQQQQQQLEQHQHPLQSTQPYYSQ